MGISKNITDVVNIGGVKVHNYTFVEVTEKILEHIEAKPGNAEYVVTPNADHILQLQHDKDFQEIYRKAFLSVPDGVSLLWASKILGTPLKERVNGTDLFEKLCEKAAEKKLKVFLLGGRLGAAFKASEILSSRHSTIEICGTYCPPMGFEKNHDEMMRINEVIQSANPDILFVGLGAPKQEKWIYSNYEKLKVPISVGIGVSFELVAGMVKRAPLWMQKTGLEWLFRLIVEPKRLWKRYVKGNPAFILLILKQKLLKAR